MLRLILYLVVITRTSIICSEFARALSFLDQMNNLENCTGNYFQVEMGCGGGFAAHFQLAASEWVLVAASANYTVPVLMTGRIRGYSDGAQCSHANHEWTCFFLPLSSCHKELLAVGHRINPPSIPPFDDNIVPPMFKSKGLAFWWGVVQSRMFRLQPSVMHYVRHEIKHMDDGNGFPFGHAVAGVHVRHGDKRSDGFQEYSLESEMNAVSKSPDCKSRNSCNVTSLTSVSDTVHRLHGRDPNILRVFIASDDPSILSAARKLGHLVDTAGVSQSTSNVGMFATLSHNPEMGFNATMEIITDIYFLAHCSTLVGLAGSQVFRMAVGMSQASGVLHYAAAMDYDQINKVRHMSRKYGVPFPESFERP